MTTRTLVFGDIHGCLGQFEALLESIAPASGDRLVLLGDLIDRGPASAGVIKRVLALACGGGPLTCLDADSGRIWQAMSGGRVERFHISDFSET